MVARLDSAVLTEPARPTHSASRRRLPARGEPLGMAGWAAHFEQRLASPPAIPWSSGASMKHEEIALIMPSLKVFQLGESSEGRHLLRAAARHAARVGDPAWLEAVRLHIRDEQHHAALLARVLELHGAEPLTSCWADRAFRGLRRFTGGLGTQNLVLTTAELLAMTYYQAVHEASASTIVRAVCRRILADEVGHLRFQAEILARLQLDRDPWRRAADVLALRTLHAAAREVLWLEHGAVLRAGGFDRPRFRRHTAQWLDRFLDDAAALRAAIGAHA